MGQASTVETKIDALAAKIVGAEASAAKTQSIADAVGELTGRLAALEPRTKIVEELEKRLNTLNTLSADVDRRLCDQLARRAELESLNVLCDGLAIQMTDAQQKLATLNAARGELEPAMARLVVLQEDLGRARATLGELQRDEDTLAEQERRLTALGETARALSLEGSPAPRGGPGPPGGVGAGRVIQRAPRRRARADPEATARHVRSDQGRGRAIQPCRRAL